MRLPIELSLPAITRSRLFDFAHARGQSPSDFVADLITAWADGPGRDWAEAEPLDPWEIGRDEMRHKALAYLRMSADERADYDAAGLSAAEWFARHNEARNED